VNHLLAWVERLHAELSDSREIPGTHDSARQENAFGLMSSLNMLIENADAFDYTGSDFAV
jgi:hypothetical protein